VEVSSKLRKIVEQLFVVGGEEYNHLNVFVELVHDANPELDLLGFHFVEDVVVVEVLQVGDVVVRLVACDQVVQLEVDDLEGGLDGFLHVVQVELVQFRVELARPHRHLLLLALGPDGTQLFVVRYRHVFTQLLDVRLHVLELQIQVQEILHFPAVDLLLYTLQSDRNRTFQIACHLILDS